MYDTKTAECQTPDAEVWCDIETTLAHLELLSDEEFHAFEFELVSRYRRFEDEQEAIAIALTRNNISSDTKPLAHERILEILVMLQHVHDPFIH
jgi:hypothetical protein